MDRKHELKEIGLNRENLNLKESCLFHLLNRYYRKEISKNALIELILFDDWYNNLYKIEEKKKDILNTVESCKANQCVGLLYQSKTSSENLEKWHLEDLVNKVDDLWFKKLEINPPNYPEFVFSVKDNEGESFTYNGFVFLHERKIKSFKPNPKNLSSINITPNEFLYIDP